MVVQSMKHNLDDTHMTIEFNEDGSGCLRRIEGCGTFVLSSEQLENLTDILADRAYYLSHTEIERMSDDGWGTYINKLTKGL